MATTRMTRAATTAREEILADLKNDHRRVKKAYKEFQGLDGKRVDGEGQGASRHRQSRSLHARVAR